MPLGNVSNHILDRYILSISVVSVSVKMKMEPIAIFCHVREDQMSNVSEPARNTGDDWQFLSHSAVCIEIISNRMVSFYNISLYITLDPSDR